MATKLFSESFREIHKDSELAELQTLFPEYDAGYLCQAAGFGSQQIRVWMEALWEKYEPHADSQFLTDFRRQLTQRSWELYLGATFLNRGFRIGTHSDAGPDFRIEDGTGDLLTWVEAVAPGKGTGDDRVPDVKRQVSGLPEDAMLLRLTSVLDIKFKKYQTDVLNGTVKDDEPYVIAINRSDLEYFDVLLPLIIKALYAVGHLTLQAEIGTTGLREPKSSWSMRGSVNKQNGRDIPTRFFMSDAHAGISAVIYCADNILNSPRLPGEMGENFVIAHNPYAKNPLPAEFFPFGAVYGPEGQYVKMTRKRKEWVSRLI